MRYVALLIDLYEYLVSFLIDNLSDEIGVTE